MSTLVGKKAPDFKAKAVANKGIVDGLTLSQFLGQYVVLFFYPLDFTFVCPTELHAFEEKREEFEKRQCQLIACSVDSVYTHLAWVNTPKEKGGISGVTYPLVSDINKEISTAYGVLVPNEGITYRGLFLIDRQGIIRHQVINDLPLGRSVDEVLRMLDAWIFFEKHGEVCPANWKQGSAAMKPTQKGLEEYFTNEFPMAKKN